MQEIARYLDEENGMAATVTDTGRGYLVRLLDLDADEYVSSEKLYPHDEHGRQTSVLYAGAIAAGIAEVSRA